MASNEKWVFFDMDGTLADSIPEMYNIYLDFLFHFNKMGDAGEFNELNGPSLVEIVQIIKKRYGLVMDLHDLMLVYEDKMCKAYENNIKPADGAIEVLRKLSQQRYKIALVSSANKKVASIFIHKYGLDKYIHEFVFGDEVKKAKPDPEIYLLALRKNNIITESATVIEDSENGIKAAKAAGLKVIGYADHTDRKSLEKCGADCTVSKLEEVISLLGCD